MQPKKKVCFFITKGVWGGAGRYVFDLATGLPKDRFEAVVICGQGEALPEKLHAAGIRTIQLPKLKRDFSFFSAVTIGLQTLAILRTERPNILHLNSAKASGVGAVAGRLCGIQKIIYTVHGFAFNENRNAMSKTLIWFFSWITILLSHKTIVIAKKEKDQAFAMPLTTRKIVLIHNGVTPATFKKKEESRSQLLVWENPDAVFWLGTIAELHPNKGLEYLLEAVSKIISPFVLVIIGEGEERKKLEKLVLDLNLEKKVFFAGFVPHADEYLPAFDIFLLPSVKEGLPYTIIEAGFAGLPVIASRVGGIPDIIENNMSGTLTAPSIPTEITQAIEYLLLNPDKRKEFGDNLKTTVERDFSLEQMLDKTIALYL